MQEVGAVQRLDESARDQSIRLAVDRLRHCLRRAGDDPLRIELLEDDLREGYRCLDSLEEFFDGVLSLLKNSEIRACDLAEAADDSRVLDHLDSLGAIVDDVRRRLIQLVARKAHPRTLSRAPVRDALKIVDGDGARPST